MHQRLDLLVGLHAVDRLLHLRIEVLDAERDAVEAERLQVRQALARDGAGIDLDRVLAARQQRHAPAQHVHQRCQLRIVEERRRAATEVQLRHHRHLTERLADQIQLLLQRLQVGPDTTVVARDDLVARAVVAYRLAERHVHVDRHRRPGPAHTAEIAALRQRLLVMFGRECLDEPIGRRVRGVARPRAIHPSKQFLGQYRLGIDVRHPVASRRDRTRATGN